MNEFAAGAAWRHHGNLPARLTGLGMPDRHDRLDALVALLRQRASDRDRFGAHRAAPHIGVEIDAGHDTAIARADRRADLLPVVAIALLDRLRGRGDQFLVPVVQRLTHCYFADSFSP